MKVNLGTQIYNVTFEPLRSKVKQKLPKEDYHLFLKLHKQAKNREVSVLTPLLELHQKYPRFPEIANLLTFVYFQKKEIKKGEKLIQENYENNPTDLFARINYADHCLRKKELAKIPLIFENTFDLKLLYPSREIFHYSEVSGFALLMSFYHLAINKRAQALEFYKVAVQMDPHARGLSSLERRLFPEGFFKKILRTLHSYLRSCKILFQRKKS